MDYIVTLNYTQFKFDSGNTALTFAEIAKNYAVDDINVEIEIEGTILPVEDDITEAFDDEGDE